MRCCPSAEILKRDGRPTPSQRAQCSTMPGSLNTASTPVTVGASGKERMSSGWFAAQWKHSRLFSHTSFQLPFSTMVELKATLVSARSWGAR